MILGAQLYTVREHTRDLKQFFETLKRVADIGYTCVQVSGTCDFEPQWLAEKLKETALLCPLTHVSPQRLVDSPARVVSEHQIFGCGVVGIGGAPGGFSGGIKDYEKFRETFLPVAEAIKSAGALLGFHNHHYEFQKFGQKTILARMAEDFSAENLTFILDTYWVQYGGGSPAAWLRKLAGRVSRVHFKDMNVSVNTPRMAAVGEGNMDWGGILAACSDAGTEYAFVEQDDCYGDDPFDCLKRSFQNLRALGVS